MSDASEVKRWETPHMMRYRLPSERKSDTDHVTESYAYPCVVVLASDHDRIMAERDELWKRATKFVMPGEMDTGESIEHYIKTLEATNARQARVIEKLKDVVTCVGCDANESCPYAWDGYNTNGDCLAEK